MATAEVLVEVGSAEGNELSVHEKKYHQAQNNKYYSNPIDDAVREAGGFWLPVGEAAATPTYRPSVTLNIYWPNFNG